MNGGVYKDKRILEESTIDEMHSIQYPNGHYGLGWMFFGDDEDGFQGHGGLWLGCDSNMLMRPSDNIGVIFFLNKAVLTSKDRSIYFKIREELILKAEQF